MTALDALQELIEDPDLNVRREKLAAWGEKWLAEATVEEIVKMDGDTKDPQLLDVTRRLKDSLLTFIGNSKETMFYEAKPTSRPGEVKLRLGLRLVLKTPAGPPEERPRIVPA